MKARPKFTVLKPLGEPKAGCPTAKAELRQYEPHLIAEITVEADDVATAVRQGDQQLTAFIHGANVPPCPADAKQQRKGKLVALTSMTRMETPIVKLQRTRGNKLRSKGTDDGVLAPLTAEAQGTTSAPR